MPRKSESARREVALQPGSRVIITQNPHDLREEGLVGTVICYRAEAGFAGCDLVDVHYKSPVSGAGRTRPFGLACLAEATPEAVECLAQQYEARARALRRIAASEGESG